MAQTILVTEEINHAGIKVLTSRGFDVDVRVGISRDELISCIGNYDALIIRSHTQLDREVIEAARGRLKVIGRAGVSIDNVDLDAATEQGIIVCNAPNSNIMSTAEYTLALLLAAARCIPLANASLHAGCFDDAPFEGSELFEKTLAIVGLGRVGTLVAQRAAAFGMRLVGYDPYCSVDRASSLGVELFESVEALLPVADFITVHAPKTSETCGMFGAEQFAAMKDGVIIVNVSSSAIFDEKSLADFIAAGKVRAVGFDAFGCAPKCAPKCSPGHEPAQVSEHELGHAPGRSHESHKLEANTPLAEFPQAILTPHIGAHTIEARCRASVQIATFVAQALAGSMVSTAVNLSNVPPEVMDKFGPYLTAAEMMGRIIQQLEGDIPHDLTLTAAGTLSSADSSLLLASTLKGLMAYKAIGAVSAQNAEAVASRHGIKTSVCSTVTAAGYDSMLNLETPACSIACTVYGTERPARIISLFGYRFDIEPSAQSLIVRYPDAPGRMGIIGTVLGEAGVNITTMQIGSREESDDVVVILNLEGDFTSEIEARMRNAIPELQDLWHISL